MSDAYGLSQQSADLFRQWRDEGTAQPAAAPGAGHKRIAFLMLEAWDNSWSQGRRFRPARVVRFEINSSGEDDSPEFDWYCAGEESDAWFGCGSYAKVLTNFDDAVFPRIYIGVLVGYNPADGKPVYMGQQDTLTETCHGGGATYGTPDTNTIGPQIPYRYRGRWYLLTPGSSGDKLTLCNVTGDTSYLIPKWTGTTGFVFSAAPGSAGTSDLGDCPVSPPPGDYPPSPLPPPPATSPPPTPPSPPTYNPPPPSPPHPGWIDPTP